MSGIFISYRRADSAPYAGRLRDSLSNRFGADKVFLDINTINPGERFPGVVEQSINACAALLAVIGPTWLPVTDAKGQRRLDNPNDPVRNEIATALRRSDVLVIPILIGTTPMPTAAELPEALVSLADCNALRLTDEGWVDQVARLIRELEKVQHTAAQALPQDLPADATAPASFVARGAAMGSNAGSPQRALAVAKLVEAVRLQWTEEAKLRGLFDPEPMPVQWTLTERDIADRNRNIARGPLVVGGSSGRIDELTRQFLDLSRRRLVVLGGPGSGKSTLAVLLLLHLVKVRQPADPVPVFLTANGWDTTAHPRLRDWLVFRLGKDYPALRAFGEAIPGELVDSGLVLPIIDGLDELDPEYRPALLKTLNTSLGETDPLVLTCRTDEFVDAVDNADVLTAAAVIEARPLSPEEAAEYLDGCLPPRQRSRWEPILAKLRSDDGTPVADVCATPLGIWLLRTVYIENKRDPSSLVDAARYPDADAIKADLFEQLIPAFISERQPVRDGSDPLRPRRAWDPGATRQWMAQLAMQLDGQRDLRWWELPSTLPSRVLTTVIALTGVVLPGIVIGLCLGLGLALFASSRGSPASVLLVSIGLAVGVSTSVGVAPAFIMLVGPRLRSTPEPGFTNVRVRGRGGDLAKKLAEGLTFGLALGLLAGMTSGSALALMNRFDDVNLSSWVIAVAIAASLGALLYRRRREKRSPGSFDRPWTPDLRRRAVRNYAIVSPLLLGTLFAIAALLEPAQLPAQMARDMLRFGLLGAAAGLSIGLAIGVARWMRSPGSDDRSRTPMSTYRGSRNVMAFSALLFPMMGAILGVGVATVLAALHVHTGAGRTTYVVIGLVIGSMVGLVVGPMQEPSWVGFVGAARWLAFRRRLPWRVMAFLDDAHRLGLLRTVGSVYQFRHAELQDHLAESQRT